MKIFRHTILVQILLFSLVSSFSSSILVSAQSVCSATPIQVTTNLTNDLHPQISGSNVVWYADDGTGDSEIFFWDGITTIQLTDNLVDDYEPQIIGSNVVWETDDLNDSEIFFWDGITTIQLTDNLVEDRFPLIDSTSVSWHQNNSTFGSIFVVWDGSTFTNVFNPPEESTAAHVLPHTMGGGLIAWRIIVSGSEYAIAYWDGTNSSVLAYNTSGTVAELSGGNAVWIGDDGNVYVWDGITTTQVTNTPYANDMPHIDGSNVVWSGGLNFTATEIFFWDGTTITQVTNNTLNDRVPRISGNNVVWFAHDGNDFEVFFWDGTTVFQITDNNIADTIPVISGTNIAWQAYDGIDSEIYYLDTTTCSNSSTPVYNSNPIPSDIITLTGAAGTMQAASLSINNIGDIGSLLDVTQVGTLNDFVISTLPTSLTPSDGTVDVTISCTVPQTSETLTLQTNEPGNPTYTYTLECQANPPTVVSTTPLDGAVDVPVDTDVVINFSEMMCGLSASVICDSGGFFIGSGGTGCTPYADTMTLGSPWEAGDTCTVTVSGIGSDNRPLDGDGDGIGGDDYVFSFTVASPVFDSDPVPNSIVSLLGTPTLTAQNILNISNVGSASSVLDVTQVGTLNNFTVSTLPTSLTPSDGAYPVTISCTVPQASETLTLQTNEPGNPTYTYTLDCKSEFYAVMIGFDSDSSITQEDDGTLSIPVTMTIADYGQMFTGMIEIVINETGVGTAVSGTDYTYTQQTLTWDCSAGCLPGTTSTQTVSLTLLTDGANEGDETIVLQINAVDVLPPYSYPTNFTHTITVHDTTLPPPVVVSTTPLDGAVDVPVDTDIVVNFNEIVDTASISVTCGSTVYSPLVTIGLADDTFTMAAAPWATGETCTVTVSTTTFDGRQLDGNGDGIGGDSYTFNFTTQGEAVYDSNPAPDSTITLSMFPGQTATSMLSISNTGAAGTALEVIQVGTLNNFTISTLPIGLTLTDGAVDVTISCTVPQAIETLIVQTNEPGNPTYRYNLECRSSVYVLSVGFDSDSSITLETDGTLTIPLSLTLTDYGAGYNEIFYVTVSDNTGSSTATNGIDSTFNPQTVSFDCQAGCAAGITLTQNVTLTPLSDAEIEGDETVLLYISAIDSSPMPPFSTWTILEHQVTIQDIVAEITPEPTEEVTPEVTPEITPEPTEEVTPEVTPEITPEVTPEITPELTDEPTPEVTDEPAVLPAETQASDNFQADAAELVISLFDPAISKIGFLQPGEVGITDEQVEWIVTVSNTGNIAGQNVVITDTLVAALRIDSVNAPGAAVNTSGQTVTVTYPVINPGESVQFSIFTTVLQGVEVTNTACVNASNQAASECATGNAITGLPETGETPFWRHWFWLLVIVPLTGLLMWRRKLQQ